MLEDALQSEVAAIVEMDDNRPLCARRLCSWRRRWTQRRGERREAELRGRRVPVSGMEQRLSAGLGEGDAFTGALPLHLSEYHNDKPLLLFCAQLPDNEVSPLSPASFSIPRVSLNNCPPPPSPGGAGKGG